MTPQEQFEALLFEMQERSKALRGTARFHRKQAAESREASDLANKAAEDAERLAEEYELALRKLPHMPVADASFDQVAI